MTSKTAARSRRIRMVRCQERGRSFVTLRRAISVLCVERKSG